MSLVIAVSIIISILLLIKAYSMLKGNTLQKSLGAAYFYFAIAMLLFSGFGIFVYLFLLPNLPLLILSFIGLSILFFSRK